MRLWRIIRVFVAYKLLFMQILIWLFEVYASALQKVRAQRCALFFLPNFSIKTNHMADQTATIIGSTGMIGTYLQQQLLEDNYYSAVRILVRRPLPVTHEKLEVRLVNFDDLESVLVALYNSDVVFSCIGTTNKNVKGDKKLYWKIDHDIPVNACRLAKETGCGKFIMVSSTGANAKSGNFYIRLKGKTEEDVIATGMPEVHIMRPGMLLGNRKERRPAEKLMQAIMKPISKVMVGRTRQFRAIEGADVARAMVAASKLNNKGVHIYTYDDLMKLATAPSTPSED